METLRQLISTSPAELLIASIWQGLLLTAFAWAALKLAGRLRASTRFTVWLIVFTLVALLPVFSLGLALWRTQSAHVASSFLPQAGLSLRMNIVWAFAIEAAWAMASLYSLTRLLLSIWQMTRLLQDSTLVAFANLDQEMQFIVTRPGSRPVEVRLSDAVDAPSVIGFFRPSIVVPRSVWNELPPEDMKQVVQHEMAHLERGDDWTNLFQKLLRALCPLNPALLWAERHLCREREQACDDAVLDAAGNARAYATCLTKLAENRLVKRAALLAPGLWKRRSELAARIENILHRRRGLPPLLSRGLVAASLLASLSGVFALQLCPRLVTFSDGYADAEARNAHAAPRPLFDGKGVDAHAYPAAYRMQQQPHYQDAVFHPQVNDGVATGHSSVGAAPVEVSVRANAHPQRKKAAAKTAHAKARITHNLPSASLRVIELSNSDGSRAGVAWIVFTVEAGSEVSYGASFRDAVETDLPSLSNSTNWIFFQI